MSRRSLLPAFALALALGACAHRAPAPEPVVGMLRHLDGSSLSLAGLRGRPAVLFVLTTWSAPSLVDLPRLAAIHARHGDRLHILAVALDEEGAAIEVFSDTFSPPFPVVVPDDRPRFIGDQGPLGPITTIPSTTLLDAEGRVFGRFDGAWPPGALEAAVARLLAADPASR